MATLPSATTRINDQSGGVATGTELIAVWAPVPTLADCTPRLYSSAAAILQNHGYSAGADYAAEHIAQTSKPVLFVPLPIETAGSVGRFNSSGNTGTSVVSCAAAPGGVQEETDGVVKIVSGGTIGTSSIVVAISCDGGRNFKTIKLGTGNSYTIPYVGLVLSFGAGTLVAGDTVLSWHSTAPLSGPTGQALARTNIAKQLLLNRSWLLIGDVSVKGDTDAMVNAVNTYETDCERYTQLKMSMRDRLPLASLSQAPARMTGNPNLTFAATGFTVTRSAGSFLTDGFAVGDTVTFSGTTSNNVSKVCTGVTATVLTFASGIANEGPVSNVVAVANPTLTFVSGKTVTRNRGSWLDDGFRAGSTITIAGTMSNNGSTADVTGVTAKVLTTTTYTFTAETVGIAAVSVVAGETDSAHIAAMDSAFGTVTGSRVELGYGRAALLSPITGWKLSRPAQWHDSIRNYQHDVCTTTWRKSDGPLKNCDMTDANGLPNCHDERTDGGALAAGFTCLRTYGNGPRGAFVAQSLTRADSNSILSMSHNAMVANLAQSVVQQATENFIGQTLVLQPADSQGRRFATAASIAVFESKVNSELGRYVLSNIGGEGPRASVAKWTAAADDDYGVASPVMHGVLDLQLNGTVVQIATTVKVK